MRILTAGARGTDVIALQKALAIKADGIFGITTERAVEGFQQTHMLTVDGIVGPATWAALGIQTPVWIEGVDTSHWEQKFDFKKGVEDGIKFMMTKASEGVGRDITCANLVGRAEEAGIKRTGIYHFFHANIRIQEQMATYMSQYRSVATNMGPILDLEETSVNGKTYAQVKELALQMLQAMEAEIGKVPVLYIDMNMLNLTGINNDARFNKYPRWIAKYSSSAPTTGWTFWQFTDKGEQGADTDWFHGTEADMDKFFGIAA